MQKRYIQSMNSQDLREAQMSFVEPWDLYPSYIGREVPVKEFLQRETPLILQDPQSKLQRCPMRPPKTLLGSPCTQFFPHEQIPVDTTYKGTCSFSVTVCLVILSCSSTSVTGHLHTQYFASKTSRLGFENVNWTCLLPSSTSGDGCVSVCCRGVFV